ncbi:Transcription factor IIIB 70 kDa subunit BRF [Giardia lamblia P15]|uniref:Transcription factor IIIB 70 kDa subunit BRF n=1 Tax=Giardia intestinalis (strain P15) TaxID=658858 RepID=E1EYE1_GIAIA|nr:Transcription factor IIIB 70 kDa subunit BRF [Giardia lamblia P15]
MSISCPFCLSSSTITDEGQAKVFCGNCGLVIMDTLIVNDLIYQDQNGVSTVMGNFISANTSSTARSLAIKHFSKELETIAMILNLPMELVRKASDYYANCLRDKVTRGRRNNLLAAALLYIVGRQHNLSHLLIDYADALNVSVFTLNKYIQPFLRQYNIKLPYQDLESLLPRFVDSILKEEFTATFQDNRDCMLFANIHITSVDQLREHTLVVSKYILKASTAINIHTGRLPSGLLGASIFVALKLLNYGIPIHRVSRCVFCSPDTVARRLQEMQSSELFAKLTIGDVLRNVDLVLENIDVRPPSLVRRQLYYRQYPESVVHEKLASLGSLLVQGAQTTSMSIPIDMSLANDISIQEYIAPAGIRQAKLQLFDAQYGDFYRALQAAREGTVEPEEDASMQRKRQRSEHRGLTAAESVRNDRGLPASIREDLAHHLEGGALDSFQSESSLHNAVSSEIDYEYEHEQEPRSLWAIFNE